MPLAEAAPHGDGIRVPYAAAKIEQAPSAKPDGALTQDEEARLYDHYGLVPGESRSGSGLLEYEDDPAISEEEHEVVLHEEEVVVEKRVVPQERVRMDKQLVSDEQTVSDEIRKQQGAFVNATNVARGS